MADQYSIVYIYNTSSLSTHLFMGDWFTFFHMLIIINSATMNTGVHLSFRIRVFVFSRYMSRSGIAGWDEYLNRNMNIGKDKKESVKV